MTLANVVRINAYRHRPSSTCGPTWPCATAWFGDPPPASTLMIVSGFARPEFKVEVEVIAAG